MNIKNIFRRKKEDRVEPAHLRIQGVSPAPLTPEPDDAELAAQALLEHMCEVRGKKEDGKRQPSGLQPPTSNLQPQTSEYYHKLADRIRSARESARLRTMRFVAFVEQELEKKDLPVSGDGSLQLLEAELYKRIDTVEREEGELKRRWQHCLAEVTVRLMKASGPLSSE